MVLAILQQTRTSLDAQQEQMLTMQTAFLSDHDSSAVFAQWTSLYAAYLAEALAANSGLRLTVQTHLLHLNSSKTLLPVSRHSLPFAK